MKFKDDGAGQQVVKMKVFMMRRLFVFAALCASVSGAAQKLAPVSPRPKLVVGIVFDQFRYDYLTRFRDEYSGGFDLLLKRGAVFTNARYVHFPTVTAVGHATFMTGATPAMSGIIGNEWYDRESGKQVTSVSDEGTRLLGTSGDRAGASPNRLLVSTVGDEMKLSGRAKTRVIGVSLKDRAAILPSGHMSDGAYWFDDQTGNFVSSTFYFPELPAWVKDFNDGRPADKYLKAGWKPIVPGPGEGASTVYKKMAAAPSQEFYGSLEASPYGNELVEQFAERAIDAEKLGQRGVTDLLTVSFSSNDYVGHGVGPHAPEVRDISIRSDRLLGKFLKFLDARVGLSNVVLVLTADHGVAPLPEYLTNHRMPGGRLNGKELSGAIQSALSAKYGEGKWIVGTTGSSPYFNRELIRLKRLNEAEVEKTAAEAVAAMPHIYSAYTRDQLQSGRVPDSPVSRRVINGFHPRRAGDLVIIDDPYWIEALKGTTHGAPFGYDAHVPVIFMGPGIRTGTYNQEVAPNDIAPTLATLLSIETPSGTAGRPLYEILVGQTQ
jgi:predicted AlkP superfamily pyrophosphatase or phosphodiesterase